MWDKKHKKNLFRLTIAVVILFVCAIETQSSPRVVVIVHPENYISEISVQQLRRIYYGRQTIWSQGGKIEAIDLKKDRNERQEFSQIVFQHDVETVERNYLKMALSGTGHPPLVLSTPREVLAFIASNPNAIGYVDEADIDKTSPVKIILIRE